MHSDMCLSTVRGFAVWLLLVNLIEDQFHSNSIQPIQIYTGDRRYIGEWRLEDIGPIGECMMDIEIFK